MSASNGNNPDSYKSRQGRPGEYLVSDGGAFIWWAQAQEPAAVIVGPANVVAMARLSSPVDANGSPVREEASWA